MLIQKFGDVFTHLAVTVYGFEKGQKMSQISYTKPTKERQKYVYHS